MPKRIRLLVDAPEIEISNGMVFMLVNGKRKFAFTRHVALTTNESIRRAVVKLDTASRKKVVSIR